MTYGAPDADFYPPALLRHAHAQSVLASLKIRLPFIHHRAGDMMAASTYTVIEGDDGVRLSGLYTPAADGAPLVVLIHGWEGSASSQYILSCAAHLWRRGYAIFRLQLRDHGDSHHLNPEVFHSCRLDETAESVRQIAQRYAPPQLFLGGFSLGGNFSLRIAAVAETIGLSLDGVCAVSPVIDPSPTLRHMQNGPAIYRYYFMRKWRRSLRTKHNHFPDAFDMSVLDTHRELLPLTKVLVETVGGFDTVEDYFDGYSVRGDRLSTVTAPTAILSAIDDPIVPDEPLAALPPQPNIRVERRKHGGHCGFLFNLHRESYADHFMLDWFEQHRRSTSHA
ncbi:MAG: alpha/beta fold hydrolase [Pseudomonadota bacterium]